MSTMTASKTPIARFLYANGISKKEVAGFLGISPQAVSQMATGRMKVPGRVYSALVGNDRGWDTTALTNPAEDGTETLRALLRAKDEQIAELLRIIDKLTPGKP